MTAPNRSRGDRAGRIRGGAGPSNPGEDADVPADAKAAAGPEDREVIERARSGDHDAFRVLVERYQGRVYRLALRVLRDEEQARDAVQDAFLKVYRSLDRFQGRSSFYTWLYRLVLNVCLDLRRRDRLDRQVEWSEERWEQASEEDAGPDPISGSPSPDPELALDRAELGSAIAAAIRSLPDDARRTLLLREVDGLSYAEIATVLGVPRGTVMSRLHYARRRLRLALVAAGAAEPDRLAPAGEGGEE